jgi:hypothetical protein
MTVAASDAPKAIGRDSPDERRHPAGRVEPPEDGESDSGYDGGQPHALDRVGQQGAPRTVAPEPGERIKAHDHEKADGEEHDELGRRKDRPVLPDLHRPQQRQTDEQAARDRPEVITGGMRNRPAVGTVPGRRRYRSPVRRFAVCGSGRLPAAAS